MSDMPFFVGMVSAGGIGGSSDYDELSNKPVVNLIGSPVVICELETGVYNIEGSWVMTEDGIAMETLKDDLFYVSNDNNECKLTWISAGEIRTYHVPKNGTAGDVVEDSVATKDEVISSLVGSF